VYELGKERAVTKFLKLLKDISGASAAEYALILAIVGAAIAIASVQLGGAIGGAMKKTSDCISDTTQCPTASTAPTAPTAP
jgi:pilus assembly protein Flp/PilA